MHIVPNTKCQQVLLLALWLVHLVAADPQTKSTDLSCESAGRVPPSTSTIAIYYYYSAQKLILIFPSHTGWKAKLTRVRPIPCWRPIPHTISHSYTNTDT